MPEGVLIDGSAGDQGGQVVRTALALSALTGRAVRLVRIRAGRPTPGLTPDLLVTIRALANCCAARIGGATEGSSDLAFLPGALRPLEELRIHLDGAEPATLALQAVAVPLSTASGSSRVLLSGGTHVPKSPTTDFLESDWIPAMEAAGLPLSIKLRSAGYLPDGNGELIALIPGNGSPRALHRPVRGNLKVVQGIAWVTNVPVDVGERLAREARRQLRRSGVAVRVDVETRPGRGQGAGIHVVAVTEDGYRTGFSMIADRTRPAERTARGVVNELFSWLDTGAALNGSLAEQILTPLALATGPSTFTTSRVTAHLRAVAGVIQKFLPARISVRGEEGSTGEIRVEPGPAR